MSPGPDLLITTKMAVSGSRRRALAAVAGIGTGTAIWATIAATGMAFILAQEQWLENAIRWCGATYLLFLAFQSFRHARAPLAEAVPADRKYSARTGWEIFSSWRTGLLTDLSNPKAAVFWCSIFAAFTPKGSPTWLFVAMVSLSTLIASCWYAAAALLLSVERVLVFYKKAKRWIDYISGGVLIGLAIRIATAN